ncbi:MAG: glycosyltransferase [Sphingomonadaceae bacterium]
MQRHTILFMAEAVTLAHLARPLALAQRLDPQRYALHLASAVGYDAFFAGSPVQRWPLRSISSAQFLAALAAGKPVYDAATLEGYVEEDLQLLSALRPALVIGDFRLSLAVSARLAQVPYVALSNAYWSPYVRQHYRVPSLALSRVLPLALADGLFRAVRPLAFALHTLPLNQVRRRHGLASLGWDLRRLYTEGDRTLYADIPELFAPQQMPASHSYLGPVLWSPPVALPAWWASLPAGRPLVYVTLGSSGQGALLAGVLRALARLPVTVVAATAGRVALDAVPENAHVAPFLPGDVVTQRASLVICNGGSPTSQQALAAGVPVLGIAANLDQFLNMGALLAAGAGQLLRADRFDEQRLRQAAEQLLASASARAAAQRIAVWFRQYDTGQRLQAVLQQLI